MAAAEGPPRRVNAARSFLVDLAAECTAHVRPAPPAAATLATIAQTAEALAEVRAAAAEPGAKTAPRAEGVAGAAAPRPTANGTVAGDRAALERQLRRLMLFRHRVRGAAGGDTASGLPDAVRTEEAAAEVVCAAALLQGCVRSPVCARGDSALVADVAASVCESRGVAFTGETAQRWQRDVARFVGMARGYQRVEVTPTDTKGMVSAALWAAKPWTQASAGLHPNEAAGLLARFKIHTPLMHGRLRIFLEMMRSPSEPRVRGFAARLAERDRPFLTECVALSSRSMPPLPAVSTVHPQLPVEWDHGTVLLSVLPVDAPPFPDVFRSTKKATSKSGGGGFARMFRILATNLRGEPILVSHAGATVQGAFRSFVSLSARPLPPDASRFLFGTRELDGIDPRVMTAKQCTRAQAAVLEQILRPVVEVTARLMATFPAVSNPAPIFAGERHVRDALRSLAVVVHALQYPVVIPEKEEDGPIAAEEEAKVGGEQEGPEGLAAAPAATAAEQQQQQQEEEEEEDPYKDLPDWDMAAFYNEL